MKFTPLLLTLIFFNTTLTAFAQEKFNTGLVLDHYAIAVSELEKSGEFYTKVLGLSEIEDLTKNENIRWFSLGNGKELHLISGYTDEVKTHAGIHLALSTSHFDEYVSHLRKLKVPFYADGKEGQIRTREDGVRQIYFQDPDGYWIEINDVRQEK